jgi:hypothetical protein
MVADIKELIGSLNDKLLLTLILIRWTQFRVIQAKIILLKSEVTLHMFYLHSKCIFYTAS